MHLRHATCSMVGLAFAAAEAGQAACVPPGVWHDPAGGQTVAADGVIGRMAQRPVVLLGEDHGSVEHHRWQLHTLAQLHAYRPDLIVGFEMLPRQAQPALDAWIDGRLGESEFLAEVRWGEVWGYDPQLYMPLFQFARMYRVRAIALNVDQALVRRVGERGWAAVPDDLREGVSDPAPPVEGYVRRLREVFARHQRERGEAGGRADDETRARWFVEAQLTWDGAMAQAIADARRGSQAPLFVAVVGRGHVEYGYGVPHQLAALGVPDAAVLLAWDASRACVELRPQGEPPIADAVFGVAESAAAPPPPRLGIVVESGDGGVRIGRVLPESIAARAGLAQDDVIVEAAGVAVRSPGDIIGIVRRQAPGTWLPLAVRRQGARLEVVAKFPPP